MKINEKVLVLVQDQDAMFPRQIELGISHDLKIQVTATANGECVMATVNPIELLNDVEYLVRKIQESE